MLEWFKVLYQFFGVPHPIISTIVVFLLFGTLFSLGWLAVGKSYQKSQSEISQVDQKRVLREEARQLSREILEFLADRSRSSPRLPKPATWDIDTELMLRDSQETMNQYSIKFSAKVIAVRDKFIKYGLKDEQLENFYQHPTNSIGIRMVGERIGALAEQLR